MYEIMAVADVLKLPSIEYDWADCDADICSALDVIEGIELDGHHYAIMEQMQKDGLNAVPIHVASVERIALDYNDKAFLYMPSALGMGNGHHRLKIAFELDFMYILTSDNIDDTGEADDPITGLDEIDLDAKFSDDD